MRRGNLNNFVQCRLFGLTFASKYVTDAILSVRLEISIWYGSFDVKFSISRIPEPSIKWWLWIMRFFESLLLCLIVSLYFSGIAFINWIHWKQLLLFRWCSWYSLTVPFVSKSSDYFMKTYRDVHRHYRFECRYYTIRIDAKYRKVFPVS